MGISSNILSRKYLVLVLFFLVGFLVYSSSINSPFHYDDVPNITENPNVLINDISFESLSNSAFNNKSRLRAFSFFTFALNYYFSGFDTTSYHTVNIIIHVVNAFLIYLIILRMFSYGSSDDESRQRLLVTAFFTALIWLTTPLNTQSVILIVQRMALLMSFFFLLAFYCYLIGRERKRPLYFVLTFIFFVLSVLSKENGVIFPLVIVLYELVFVRNGDIKDVSLNEKLILIAFLVMMLFPVIAFRAEIIDYFSRSEGNFGFTVFERLLTQFRVHIFYLTLLILPLPGRLSITHDIPASTSLFSPFTTFISFILITALFVFSIVRMKKSPYLSFAILFFFITISVEAIVPLEMAYEHRMYLPGTFLICAAVMALVDRFYAHNGKALVSSFLVVSLIFAAMSGVRGRVWESEITLWADVVKKYPDDGEARYSLGTGYINAKMNQEAERHLVIAVDRMQRNMYADRQNDLVKAYDNLGIARYKLKKHGEAEKAFRKALEINPRHATAYFHLGHIYYAKKDFNKALEMYKSSFEADPGFTSAATNAGIIYIELKDYKNSLVYLNKALSLDPQNPKVLKEIKFVKQKLGMR